MHICHIIDNLRAVAVCVMDHDDILADFPADLFDMAVQLFVTSFEELTVSVRIHKQPVFRSPVVVGQDNVRFDVADQFFRHGHPVFHDVIQQLMDRIRFHNKIQQCILKSHQKMELLEETRRQSGQIPDEFPPDGSFPRPLPPVSNLPPETVHSAFCSISAIL